MVMEDTHGNVLTDRVAIGEAARRAGVSISTLRRWEREGRVTPARTFGGQRRYSVDEISLLLGQAS